MLVDPTAFRVDRNFAVALRGYYPTMEVVEDVGMRMEAHFASQNGDAQALSEPHVDHSLGVVPSHLGHAYGDRQARTASIHRRLAEENQAV